MPRRPQSPGEALFGPVLSLPEIAALDVGGLSHWIACARFQAVHGGLPEHPPAGQHWPDFDNYFPLCSDGRRRSPPVSLAIAGWLDGLAKSKEYGKMGAKARYKKNGSQLSSHPNGGEGGASFEEGAVAVPQLQLQVPEKQQVAVLQTAPAVLHTAPAGPAESATPATLAEPVAPAGPFRAGEEAWASVEAAALAHGVPVLVETVASWVQRAAQQWEGKVGKPNYGRIGAALKPIIAALGEEPALKAWGAFVESKSAKLGPQYFAEHFREYAPTVSTSVGEDTVALAAAAAFAVAKRDAKWQAIVNAMGEGRVARSWWAEAVVRHRTTGLDPVVTGYDELNEKGLV